MDHSGTNKGCACACIGRGQGRLEKKKNALDTNPCFGVGVVTQGSVELEEWSASFV